ncbi:MAG: hypothetical protein ACK5D5_03500 [Bacteroidota bacterium]|jgi:hypothetical protein
MNSWQIIISLISLGSAFIVLIILIRLSKKERKISYKELLKNENRQYLVKNNRFIAWLVAITFASVFSIFFLLKITLISLPSLLLILVLISLANLFFFRRKYKISDKTDLAFLSIVIGLGQLALLLWVNYIPLGAHEEAYRIIGKEQDVWSNITTIYLKDEAFSTYWNARTFDSANAPTGDSIIYQFKDGLIGFRIYNGHFSR